MRTGRRYRIHHVIGRGGHGSVYRATLEGTGGFTKEVAIKVLKGPATDERESVRLRDEARLLGLLRHRAILQVDGLIRLEGRWALVTEYVGGANLFQLARHQAVPIPVMLEIAGEVAGALHVAFHTPGPSGRPLRLNHRDIKLSNIQITAAGEVKLLDFGIANAEVSVREAETGPRLVGSPSYMSPERLDMMDAPQADIYALAVVFCEAISRRRFEKTSAHPVRHAEHVEAQLAGVRERVGPVIGLVEPMIRRMLAYDPECRPSAREVERWCRELRAELDGLWLVDWAERVVPQLTPPPLDDEDELVGRMVEEGTEAAPSLRASRSRTVTLGLAAALAVGAAGAGAVNGYLDDGEGELAMDAAIAGTTVRVAPRAGSLVTAGAFAAWLADHPEWQVGGVAADGAGAAYLADWEGLAPPAPERPMTGVSWWAAEAFCRGRGGLADLEAEPVRWGPEGPAREWRREGERARSLAGSGERATVVEPEAVDAETGFRCAR